MLTPVFKIEYNEKNITKDVSAYVQRFIIVIRKVKERKKILLWLDQMELTMIIKKEWKE